MMHKIPVSDSQLWIISGILFLAGIVLPMFSFQKFYIFNDSFSLLGGILHLLSEGEIFLFFVILTFSIIAPIYKLYLCKVLIAKKNLDQDKRLKIVKQLAVVGKWSMADVFVVSVIAATVKIGMFATVQIHIGLFVFSLAVLSSMVLVHKQMSEYELRPVNEL